MKILILNCHTDNRGDEAAIHGLVDELNGIYDDIQITLAIRGAGTRYPNMPKNVRMIHQFMPISKKAQLAHKMAVLTSGNIVLSSNEQVLVNEIKSSDLILHAPGGPSIGDTYYEDEPTYLKVYDLLLAMHKPYMFYAPSMGPFNKKERNNWRKRILNGAKAIVLRDPISADHVRKFLPDKKIYQTLDSAFQHDINIEINKEKLNGYKNLSSFLESHSKCVGVTITDLLWHPVHSKNKNTIKNITVSFSSFLSELVSRGYGIIFIPQLYGNGNDFDLMKSYMTDEENYFIIPDNDEKYDAYFQQYLISKVYAVIGMRYHSNIFSAKMGTPFISISYEQKMQGFMEKIQLSQYCINLADLSADLLNKKFKLLCDNYDNYKVYLKEKHDELKRDSFRTTEIVEEILGQLEKKGK